MKAQQSDRADYIVPQPTPQRFLAPAQCAGLRLDQMLAQLMPQHSRSRLQDWLRQGRVTVEGIAVTDAKRKIRGGEAIDVEPAPDLRCLPDVAEDIALDIIFEDAQILVINKPAGLVVHPGSGNWAGTLLNALLHHAAELGNIPRAGIVHRLDKETSGLMVVAKTLTAQTDLVRQLAAHSVKRHYLALAHGLIEGPGTVDAPIGRHPTQRVKMAIVANGRAARTHYQVLERFADATLLECRLETGRTHQIRVHLASIGHSLVGDPTYGKGPRNLKHGAAALATFPRQALHAWQLELCHPEGGAAMSWQAPLPADFAELIATLKAA